MGPVQPVHFVADFETLSTAPNASLLTLGLVQFDPWGNDTHETVGALPALALAFDTTDQEAYGRHVDPDTLRWWSEQSPEAQARAFQAPGKVSLFEGMTCIRDWVLSQADGAAPVIWGFGATADPVWLTTAFADVGLKNPFGYRDNLCLRTLVRFVPDEVKPERLGVKHDALADAQYEVLWAQAAYRALGITRRKRRLPSWLVAVYRALGIPR